MESSLSSPHVLELFLSKLPQSSREQYINLKNRPTMEGKPLIDVMNEFMTAERIRQGDLKRLEILGSGRRGQSETRAPAAKCGKCGKTGHLDRDCWTKQRSGSTSKVNLQQGGSSPARDKCPICSLVHTYNFQGNECVSKRLGECVEFLNLSIDD